MTASIASSTCTRSPSVAGWPLELGRNTREVTAAFIAAGIDPKAHIVFNQSQVHVHAELAWVFNCVARLGWLNRMTQFKEKAGKDRENASVGLFDYPVLMAADILAYLATHVPVGDDQKQHLELARDIAIKFNNDFAGSIDRNGFGDQFFPITEPLITGPATRVMSLRDGTKKMSKSDPSDYSRINLTDDAETIALKFRKAKTDPEPLPSEVEGLKARPEADNLVGIYAALAGESREAVLRDHGGAQFSAFKPALADLAVEKLAPIAGEMRRLLADPGHIDAHPRRRRRARRRDRREDDERRQGRGRLHPQKVRRQFLNSACPTAVVRVAASRAWRRSARVPRKVTAGNSWSSSTTRPNAAARSSLPRGAPQQHRRRSRSPLRHRAERVHRSGSASRTSCAPRRWRRPRRLLAAMPTWSATGRASSRSR